MIAKRIVSYQNYIRCSSTMDARMPCRVEKHWRMKVCRFIEFWRPYFLHHSLPFFPMHINEHHLLKFLPWSIEQTWPIMHVWSLYLCDLGLPWVLNLPLLRNCLLSCQGNLWSSYILINNKSFPYYTDLLPSFIYSNLMIAFWDFPNPKFLCNIKGKILAHRLILLSWGKYTCHAGRVCMHLIQNYSPVSLSWQVWTVDINLTS